MGQANREARLHPPSQVELGTYTLLQLIQVRVGGREIVSNDGLRHGGVGGGAGRRAHGTVESGTPWVDAVRWKAHVSEATSDVSNQSRDAEGVIVAHGGGATPAHAPTLPIILARWGTMLGTCEGRVGTSATMHGAGNSDYETMLGVGE